MKKGNHKTSWRRLIIGLSLGLAVFFVILNLPWDIDPVQQRVAAAGALFTVLWFSEALPLFVTSLLVPVVLAIITPISEKELLQPFFDPLIGLFLGSFVIAIAMEKHGLGERAAALIFKVFGRTPRKFLLGLTVTAAFLGMWLSNTATVAFLLPAVLYVIKDNKLQKSGDHFGKAIFFALAIGATVGGMGTIVGTPPNAIAVRLLADSGQSITFFEWLRFGLLMVVPMVPIVWLSLSAIFPTKIKQLKPLNLMEGKLNSKQVITLVILGLTIIFWVTGPLHGIAAPIIAIAAIVLLYATNTLGGDDFYKVPFSTLIMFGGGLSLAQALLNTGLTDTIAGALASAFSPLPVELILALLILLAVTVTLVSSNTAQAAILVPIVISLGVSLGVDIRALVVAIALGLSLDYLSPLGTPPAAIIFEAGRLHFKDFIKAGIMATVAGATILFFITLTLRT